MTDTTRQVKIIFEMMAKGAGADVAKRDLGDIEQRLKQVERQAKSTSAEIGKLGKSIKGAGQELKGLAMRMVGPAAVGASINQYLQKNQSDIAAREWMAATEKIGSASEQFGEYMTTALLPAMKVLAEVAGDVAEEMKKWKIVSPGEYATAGAFAVTKGKTARTQTPGVMAGGDFASWLWGVEAPEDLSSDKRASLMAEAVAKQFGIDVTKGAPSSDKAFYRGKSNLSTLDEFFKNMTPEKMGKSLGAFKDAMQASIKDFNAQKKQMDKLGEQARKERQSQLDQIAKLEQREVDIAEKGRERLLELQRDYMLQAARAQEDHYRDLRYMQLDYQGSMEEAIGRRDATAAMRLRRSFAIQQMRAREEFGVSQSRGREDYLLSQGALQSDLARTLVEIRGEIAEARKLIYQPTFNISGVTATDYARIKSMTRQEADAVLADAIRYAGRER